jgi:ribosomal-protein-alanine N-acetyltransferase
MHELPSPVRTKPGAFQLTCERQEVIQLLFRLRLAIVPLMIDDVLETPRLILRPLRLEDAAQAQQLFPHWEIVKYLNSVVPWPFPADGALNYYRDGALPAMARGEEWHWTLRLKTAPEQMIGSVALMRKENHNRGFWIGIPWQGRGLMTEAAQITADYWFDVLGMRVLRAPKAVENAASRRISEKTGMRLVETTVSQYVCGLLPTEIWEITAEEWQARRAKAGTVGAMIDAKRDELE